MRKTIQSEIILKELQRLGHASNTMLWQSVRQKLPNIALSSVHRITSRMIENRQIGGGLSVQGHTILDAKPSPHSHFVCSDCSTVKDIEIDSKFIDDIKKQIGGDVISTGLVVQGSCIKCRP